MATCVAGPLNSFEFEPERSGVVGDATAADAAPAWLAMQLLPMQRSRVGAPNEVTLRRIGVVRTTAEFTRVVTA